MEDPPVTTVEDLKRQQLQKLQSIAAMTGGDVPEPEFPQPEDDMKGTPRRVECVETGERFRSTKAFRDAMNISIETAAKALETGEQINGKTYRYSELPPPPTDRTPATRKPRQSAKPFERAEQADTGKDFTPITPAEPATLPASRLRVMVALFEGDASEISRVIDSMARAMGGAR